MKTFYTSDPHYGHQNIIKYTDRPFKNIKQMERVMIKNWNSVVNKEDKVIIVGDFSMRRESYRQWYEGLLKGLNGRKILVLGNHDEMKPFDYIKVGFESLHTSLLLEDKKIFIAHDPALATVMPPGYRMICGHVHKGFKLLHDPYIILNVGVDNWDYYPMSEIEVEACFETAAIRNLQ